MMGSDSKTTVGGIDCDLKGAVSFITGNDAQVFDMPVIGKNINIPALAAIIKSAAPDIVFVEHQQPFKKQGIVSTCTTCRNFGAVLGMLATLSIPTFETRPAQWKKGFGLDRDKEKSRALAIQLYPTLADQLSLKKHHGRAESALIATWGQHQWVNANDNDIRELRDAS